VKSLKSITKVDRGGIGGGSDSGVPPAPFLVAEHPETERASKVDIKNIWTPTKNGRFFTAVSFQNSFQIPHPVFQKTL
jgi:hypothetical protein